jgi:hypothetical protein
MPSQDLKNLSIGLASQNTNATNAAMQSLANSNPELAHKAMDARGFTNSPNINASNVPASLVDGNVASIQIPPAPAIQTDMGVVAEGKTLLDRTQQEQEATLAKESNVRSENELAILRSMGFLGTESAERERQNEQQGVNAFSQDLRKFQESLRRQVAELDQFDVDNVNTLEQMRVDASRRDITKRTYSAMSAEANIQNAVQRANKVAATRATIAAIDVTQGNLQAATEQVDKALKSIYEPRRQQLQMEMFFLERNDKRFDSAQKDLANTRMMQIQREQAQMDRAQEMVNAAVMSGGATPEEVQSMVVEQDITKQTQMAMGIVGRVNAADRALERAYKGMQIANIQSQIEERNAVDSETNNPLTQSQYTALGYAERVVEASMTIDSIGDQFSSAWSVVGARIPNNLKSEERQQFEQAQRNFVNAVLRRESGAAIAESEFESAAKQYFPQPGDKPSVLAQKKVNRETVARNLLREGGQPTDVQERNINDPLGLGIATDNRITDPLGIGSQSQSTLAF